MGVKEEFRMGAELIEGARAARSFIDGEREIAHARARERERSERERSTAHSAMRSSPHGRAGGRAGGGGGGRGEENLGQVAEHLGEEGILALEQPVQKAVEILARRHGLGISRVGCQVDCESDERLFHELVGEVLDHVDDHGYAVGVGKHGLALVVHRYVVQHLERQMPHCRHFEQFDQFRDYAVFDHLGAHDGVEGEVQDEAQRRHGHVLRGRRYKGHERLHNVALPHLVLVLLEYRKLLQERHRLNRKVDSIPIHDM